MVAHLLGGGEEAHVGIVGQKGPMFRRVRVEPAAPDGADFIGAIGGEVAIGLAQQTEHHPGVGDGPGVVRPGHRAVPFPAGGGEALPAVAVEAAAQAGRLRHRRKPGESFLGTGAHEGHIHPKPLRIGGILGRGLVQCGVVGKGEPAGAWRPRRLQAPPQGLLGAEDVVVMAEVGQKQAAPVDRIPGIIGEVVHHLSPLALHRLEDPGCQGQDACYHHKRGVFGPDALQQLPLEAPPLPGAPIREAIEDFAPSCRHAGREGGGGGGVGHADLIGLQTGPVSPCQQLGAQGLGRGGVGEQKQAAGHRLATGGKGGKGTASSPPEGAAERRVRRASVFPARSFSPRDAVGKSEHAIR